MYDSQKNKLLGFIGEDIIEQLEISEAIVAGGAITSIFCNRDINDIDIYFRSKEKLAQFVRETSKMVTPICYTDKSATFLRCECSNKVILQLIFFDYFDSAKNVFEAFDFSCCMGAYDFKINSFVLHDDFLVSNSGRILKLAGKTRFPISSILRIKKYESRGYIIPKSDIIRLCLLASIHEIGSWDEAVSNVGGVYGIIAKNVFDITREFSIEEMFSQMESLNGSFDEKINKAETGIFDIRELIADIIGVKTKCIQHPTFLDNVIINNNGTLQIESFNNKLYEYADDPFDVMPKYLYKLVEDVPVKLGNGSVEHHYRSCHSSFYEYYIGKEVSSESPGLFFSVNKDLSTWERIFSDNKNKVVLECTYNPADIITLNYEKIQLNKVYVTDVMSIEKYKETNKFKKESDFPF